MVVQNVRKSVDLSTERAVLPQTRLDKGVHCRDKFPIGTQVRSTISSSDWTILVNLYPLIGRRSTTRDIVCYLPHSLPRNIYEQPLSAGGVEIQ